MKVLIILHTPPGILKPLIVEKKVMEKDFIIYMIYIGLLMQIKMDGIREDSCKKSFFYII